MYLTRSYWGKRDLFHSHTLLGIINFRQSEAMLRISRSIRQTQILIKLQTFRPLSTSSSERSSHYFPHRSTYHAAGMSDKSSLDANKGSVGKEFTPKGKVGGIMQDKIGKEFQMA